MTTLEKLAVAGVFKEAGSEFEHVLLHATIAQVPDSIPEQPAAPPQQAPQIGLAAQIAVQAAAAWLLGFPVAAVLVAIDVC